jgi:hypothetical protein
MTLLTRICVLKHVFVEIEIFFIVQSVVTIHIDLCLGLSLISGATLSASIVEIATSAASATSTSVLEIAFTVLVSVPIVVLLVVYMHYSPECLP